MKKINVYSLLHVNLNERSSVALSKKSSHEQLDIYLLNAVTLCNSLKSSEIGYVLLTNRKDILEDRLGILNIEIDVVEIACDLQVPTGIRFFSAHYKIDAFKYLSGKVDQYSILCDVDMVFTSNRDKFELLTRLVESRKPIVYDITNQVNYEASENVCLQDLSMLVEDIKISKWYGGEFVGGDHLFFKKLYDECLEVFPSYLENINKIDHVGDETITSASLYRLQERGDIAVEVGSLSLVHRYWNTSKKLGFQAKFDFYKEALFLHLPADKSFLANHAFTDINHFYKRYFAYRFFSKTGIARQCKKIYRRLTGNNLTD